MNESFLLDAETFACTMDYTYVKTLLGSIGENHRQLKNLLKEKSSLCGKVQTAMDLKARTKTPLNERQQQSLRAFNGLYAREGGLLRQSLINIENAIQRNFTRQMQLHTENTEQILLSLLTLHTFQCSALYCLRRIIASGEPLLRMLTGSLSENTQ